MCSVIKFVRPNWSGIIVLVVLCCRLSSSIVVLVDCSIELVLVVDYPVVLVVNYPVVLVVDYPVVVDYSVVVAGLKCSRTLRCGLTQLLKLYGLIDG